MPQLRHALVASVIENGIKQPIQLLLETHHFPAALVLSYSGMDTMAFLNMPAAKSDVMRSDFIQWANQYVALPSDAPITGRDLYAARCSVLHGGAHSRLSRGGECKLLLHIGDEPSRDRNTDIIVTPGQSDVNNGSVTVWVSQLVAAFFDGIDRFLADVSERGEKAYLVEQRLEYLVETSPYVDESNRDS